MSKQLIHSRSICTGLGPACHLFLIENSEHYRALERLRASLPMDTDEEDPKYREALEKVNHNYPIPRITGIALTAKESQAEIKEVTCPYCLGDLASRLRLNKHFTQAKEVEAELRARFPEHATRVAPPPSAPAPTPDPEPPRHEVDNTQASEIVTFLGEVINLRNPDPERIKSTDIANALSQVNRYNGHVRRPYSVAMHCVAMATWVHETTGSAELALHALLHDAAEAYLGDVISPLKSLLPEYEELEQRFLAAIYIAFDLSAPSKEVQKYIKVVDRMAYKIEGYFLRQWKITNHLDYSEVDTCPLLLAARSTLEPTVFNSMQAMEEYLHTFEQLHNAVKYLDQKEVPPND